MTEMDVRALRLRYRAAYDAYRSASAHVSDEASRKRLEKAFKELEAAREELMAATGGGPPHACDRKGPPTKVIDETGDRPITAIFPTCSECGKPQVFPPF